MKYLQILSAVVLGSLFTACATKTVEEQQTSSHRSFMNTAYEGIMHLDMADTLFTFAPIERNLQMCAAADSNQRCVDARSMIPAAIRHTRIRAQVNDSTSCALADTTSTRHVTTRTTPPNNKLWRLFPSWLPWVFSIACFLCTIIVVFIVIKLTSVSRSL